MTHLEACKNAAIELGVTLEGPLLVTLRNGGRLLGDMLVHNFGAPKGTLVITDADSFWLNIEELREMGYAASSYDEPCEQLNSNDLREMLLDWTWCGPETLRPSWA